jgi:twinkle protein
MSGDLLQGEYRELVKRKLHEDTCRKFGYRVAEFNGKTVQVADYFDPSGTRVVAQKVRFPNKDFLILGDMKKAGLFGQHLWGSTGRMVVVTEGEIDALSMAQLQGLKWPVVSVQNGAPAAKKSIQRNLEWLCGFDSVVLMFDNDDIGRDAAAECAALFPPGKCKIASLPLKDANEMLTAGRGAECIGAMWNAKSWRPDGIVKLVDIKDRITAPITVGLPWCFPKLTELTFGRRLGEVYALGAGTGVGKTDVLTQQIAYDTEVLGEKVGLFFLEQQPEESGKRIAGKRAGKTFHIPDAGWSAEELNDTLMKMLDEDLLFFYDHFGCTEWDVIKSRIRFLAVSEGVRIFYLDHLTALAAGQDDERKALEEIMSDIGGLVKELNIIVTLISHLATPEGKPHEEGGRVMIRHFKGSRAIGFWCHYMFGLERDQHAEDEQERKQTTFRVLKDRFTGRATGEVFYLGYDQDTGRLYEAEQFVKEDGPVDTGSEF